MSRYYIAIGFDKVTSKKIYVKVARPNGIPDRQLFPHLIQLLLRLLSLPSFVEHWAF